MGYCLGMDDVEICRENMLRTMRDAGLNPNRWAKLAEVSESGVRGFLSGSSPNISLSYLAKLAAVVNMGVADFVSGATNKKTVSATSASNKNEPALDCVTQRGLIVEIDVRGGMGGGGEALALNHTDHHGNTTHVDDARAVWDMPADYLRYELRVVPDQVKLIEVQGDSMEPTLRPGDRVMVNLADKRPSPPGVFAVWDGIGVVVKRLEPIPNSDPPTLRLISDNDRHGVYERCVDEVQIIGRVVWFARRM